MANIIKAGYSRVVDPDTKKPPERSKATLEALGLEMPPDNEAGHFEQTAEETTSAASPAVPSPAAQEAYQAAYDELIQVAQEEVSNMLDDARNEALAILRSVEEEANAIRERAQGEGFDTAYTQGKAEVDDIIARAQRSMDESLAQIPLERERLLKELESQMLDIALEVAGKILHVELQNSDTAYLSMIQDAVARMPAEDTVSIRLHPDEFTRFFNKKKEHLFQTTAGQVTGKLVSDPSLNPFDAIIESPSGVVDAGADTQLSQMKRNMGIG